MENTWRKYWYAKYERSNTTDAAPTDNRLAYVPEIYEPLIPMWITGVFKIVINTEENAASLDLQKQGKEVWFYTCQPA